MVHRRMGTEQGITYICTKDNQITKCQVDNVAYQKWWCLWYRMYFLGKFRRSASTAVSWPQSTIEVRNKGTA